MKHLHVLVTEKNYKMALQLARENNLSLANAVRIIFDWFDQTEPDIKEFINRK